MFYSIQKSGTYVIVCKDLHTVLRAVEDWFYTNMYLNTDKRTVITYARNAVYHDYTMINLQKKN